MLKRVQRPRSENNKYKQLLITLNWHCVPTPINTKAIFCLHFKLHEEVKMRSVATKNAWILLRWRRTFTSFPLTRTIFPPFCSQHTGVLLMQAALRRWSAATESTCFFSSIFCRRLCELRKRQRRPVTSGATEDLSVNQPEPLWLPPTTQRDPRLRLSAPVGASVRCACWLSTNLHAGYSLGDERNRGLS